MLASFKKASKLVNSHKVKVKSEGIFFSSDWSKKKNKKTKEIVSKIWEKGKKIIERKAKMTNNKHRRYFRRFYAGIPLDWGIELHQCKIQWSTSNWNIPPWRLPEIPSLFLELRESINLQIAPRKKEDNPGKRLEAVSCQTYHNFQYRNLMSFYHSEMLVIFYMHFWNTLIRKIVFKSCLLCL